MISIGSVLYSLQDMGYECNSITDSSLRVFEKIIALSLIDREGDR